MADAKKITKTINGTEYPVLVDYAEKDTSGAVIKDTYQTKITPSVSSGTILSGLTIDGTAYTLPEGASTQTLTLTESELQGVLEGTSWTTTDTIDTSADFIIATDGDLSYVLAKRYSNTWTATWLETTNGPSYDMTFSYDGTTGTLSFKTMSLTNVVANSTSGTAGGDLTSLRIGSSYYTIPSGSGTSQTVTLTSAQYTELLTGTLAMTGTFSLDADKLILDCTASSAGTLVLSKTGYTSTTSTYTMDRSMSLTNQEFITVGITSTALMATYTLLPKVIAMGSGGVLTGLQVDTDSYSVSSGGTEVVANDTSGASGGDLSSIKIDDTSYTIPSGGGSATLMVSTTQANLRSLRDAGSLVAGCRYRITDYKAVVKQFDIGTAMGLGTTLYLGYYTAVNEGQFDIVLTALSSDKLSSEGYCVAHDGDTYFANCDLSKWKVWADLDGDVLDSSSMPTKYANAGVGSLWVYRLTDEWNNTLSYDFKNIKLRRYKATNSVTSASGYYMPFTIDLIASMMGFDSNWTIDSSDYVDVYTFTASMANTAVDESLDGTANSNDMPVNGYDLAYQMLSLDAEIIPNNQFCDTSDNPSMAGNKADWDAWFAFNTFSGMCSVNTFSGACAGNAFSGMCSANAFSGACYYNTFSGGCYYNTFSGTCSANAFSGACADNAFSGGCYYNTFSGECYYNTFSGECYYNAFSGGCYYNAFSGLCSANAFGGNTQSSTISAIGFCEISGYFQNCSFTGTAQPYYTKASSSTGSYVLAGCSLGGVNNYVRCEGGAMHDCVLEGKHYYMSVDLTGRVVGLTMHGTYGGTSSSYASISENGLYYDSTKVA